MEQNKGLGGSLIDVFDAAVNLVKTEAQVLLKRATDVIKAKGIGVVLLLAATGPLVLGLIFIILALFYGLIRLGLGAWAAAFFIALASFGLAGLLVVMGLSRLSAKLKDDEHLPEYDLNEPYTEKVSDLRAEALPLAVEGERGDVQHVNLGKARVEDLRYGVQGRESSGVAHGAGGADQGNVHLHGGAKVEGLASNKEDIVPTTPNAGRNHGDSDAGPQVPNKGSQERPGVSVSTEPTYKEDMRKEGY